MVGKELTLHLKAEGTLRRWIPDMTRGMDHFLGYLCYTWMPTDLCFLYCFHTSLGIRDDCSKSRTIPFLMYLIWVSLGFNTFVYVYIHWSFYHHIQCTLRFYLWLYLGKQLCIYTYFVIRICSISSILI